MKKKVLIFHHVSNIGGGTISLVDLCDMLCEKFDVTVLIPLYRSEELTKRLSNYAKVIYFSGIMPQISYYSGSSGILSLGFIKPFLSSKQAKTSIVEKIISEKPDIIIANSFVQCVMGKFIKNINSLKYIYIRETFKETNISKHMIKLVNKYFDGVLCIAPYEKQYAKFKIPCKVIADCFVPEKTSGGNVDIDKSKYNIMFLGGSASIKGLNVLLKALPFVKNKDIKIILCGNLDVKNNCSFKYRVFHKKMRKQNLQNANLLNKYSNIIQCTGFISNVSEWLKKCDCVVFPSTVPHQPRPALEAGYYSLPVIISDFKQTSDYFINGKNCLTFVPNDSCSLAQAIDAISSDEQLSKKLGQCNLEMTQKYHNILTEKEKLNDFLSNSFKGDKTGE